MRVLVTGKNFNIGESLKSHVDARLEQVASRYFNGAVTGHVTMEKQRNRFLAECTLHLATGLVLQSHGEAGEPYVSFDAAAEHLEKRLRRYKQRLKDHHKNRREPVRHEAAASYVIAATADDEETETTDGDLNPVVIAETASSVPELSVGEAVMQLDISSGPFVFFRNARDGTLNVVYRRADGNIGWIDPAPRSSA
jgi:ribosomal subunit interface protein